MLFLHSYIFQQHERMVEEAAKQLGFVNVSLSSTVIPMIKAVPRGFTGWLVKRLESRIKEYATCN